MESKFFKNVTYLNDLYKKEYNYWLGKITKELEKSHFPYEDNYIATHKPQLDAVSFSLPSACSQKLIQISNGSDARLHILLLAFGALLLMKYTGNSDVLLGTGILRQQGEGDYINTVLPIRLQLSNELCITDLVLLVKQVVSEAMEHQNYPIELIFKNAQKELNLMDVAIVLENIQDSDSLSNVPFNLTMIFLREGANISGRFVFNELAYGRQAVNAIIKHFIVLLENSLYNTKELLKEVCMLTKDELNIIARSNDTQAGFPEEATIHSIFDECVKNYPDRTAVVFGKDTLTYGELNQKTNQLAHQLRKLGVSNESIVAIVMPPSIEMIVSILAVLKAGGAYLPIDLKHPPQRIDYIIKDSNAKYIITLKAMGKELNAGELIFADDEKLLANPVANPDNISNPRDAAYIIYTSGTTGYPKGVVVEHRNVVRLFFHERNKFKFSCNDTWTLFHSFGFDFSVWEIFGALLYGGKLCIVPELVKRDYKQYIKLLQEENVTVLNQTPSSFYQLIQEEMKSSEKNLRLRYVILGGEALLPAKLKEWSEKYPETKIINMYGITETTVHSTYKEITREEINSNKCNIGAPFSTVKLYIFNRQMDLVPVGVTGELWVGGEGVARGYLNRQELTAERFRMCETGWGIERLYKSGDLGRYLPNGDIEYMGRQDSQIKIRGYRIEPDEIRTQLLSCEIIKDAVVMARNIDEDNKILCAYVVINENSESSFEPSAIRRYLQTRMSDYMIPSFIIPIKSIPLTINGKVDYAQLAQIELKQKSEEIIIEPGTEMEKKIAAIWRAVLKTDKVGIHSTVFDLGGTSFDMIKISRELTDVLSKEVSVVNLFTYPTISMLAKALESDGHSPELDADVRTDLIEEGKRQKLKKLKIIKE